jgi:hypothetical protein
MFDPDRPAWHGLLIARELMEPSATFDVLVDETIRPRYDLLLEIVGEMLGPRAAAQDIRRSANSVMGQLLFYHHGKHILARLEPQHEAAALDLDRLAEHIARFSIGAAKWMAQGNGGGSTA